MEGPVLIEGLTEDQSKALVGDATASMRELAQNVAPERLEALIRLVQALEIKE